MTKFSHLPIPGIRAPAGSPPGTQWPPRQFLRFAAKRLRRQRAERARFLPGSILGEPGFDILLGLAEFGTMSITGTIYTAGHPVTTGLRYVDLLQKAGLVTAGTDPADRRLKTISLSDKGVEALLRYFEAIAA